MENADVLAELFSQRGTGRDRDEWWVSKTDVISYARCSWAFWVVDSGQLARSAVLDLGAVCRFIDEGIAFESAVRSSAEKVSAGEVPALAHQGQSIILGVPVVENADLGLYGVPDGVWVSDGALLPVEVKSHRHKTRLDEIELCFYWQLLEPWRTVSTDPVGLLVLPDQHAEGNFGLLPVELSEERFEDLWELVDGVRRVRQKPPKARVCRCLICSKLEARRVFEECRARGDLTLVSGIGRPYAEALEAAGIPDLATLRSCDPANVVAVLQDAGHHRGEREVASWISHAVALLEDRPVVFGSEPFDHLDFIALDLEYDCWTPGTPIWLAGAEVVRGDRRDRYFWWADPGEEPVLLEGLAELLASHPGLAVVTWSGHSADLPTLRAACSRWDMDALYKEVEARHIDLYLYVKSAVRFPVEGLGLKLVAAQLGQIADPSLSDGLDVSGAWFRYRSVIGTSEAADLRRELTCYNADDVARLVDLVRRVRELTTEAKPT